MQCRAVRVPPVDPVQLPGFPFDAPRKGFVLRIGGNVNVGIKVWDLEAEAVLVRLGGGRG